MEARHACEINGRSWRLRATGVRWRRSSINSKYKPRRVVIKIACGDADIGGGLVR